jgi:formyltetrahydrofolate-dependent phosphoribosylglycinamide formyltransferase
MAKLGIMVGPHGRGSNMAAIIEACQSGRLPAEVAVVIGSRAGSGALERAASMGVRTAVIEPGDDYGTLLLSELGSCDWICLAGYLRLLPSEVLTRFPNRVLNIHPALLPKFGGKGMYGQRVHEAVIAAGESESGCTVHYVNEQYDEGAIILQRRCPVEPGDTPETLAARVLEQEHLAYVEALAGLLTPTTNRQTTNPPAPPPLHSPLFLALGLPLSRVLCWILMTVFGPLRVFGRSRIPRKGGLLILANHRADVDPIAIYLACPRPIYFMGKSELFAMPVVGSIMRAFRAFPVKRGEPDRAALKLAAAYTHLGNVVGVFPEGQLTEDGKLQPMKPGAALIVRLTECPVICCGLRRTDRIMPYGKVIPRPALGWVEVHWGEPRSFAKGTRPEEILGWVESELRHLSGEV